MIASRIGVSNLDTPMIASKDRAKVTHFYSAKAAEFARPLGLQVRSICGVWIDPAPLHREGLILHGRGIRRRDCKRCIAAYNRRLLEFRAKWGRDPGR